MTPDEKLYRVAARQLDLVTWSNTDEIGLTIRQLNRRAATGHLIDVHRGVYALPGADLTRPDRRALAACLAARPDAYAWRSTSAAAWGLRGDDPAGPHVVVPMTRRPEPPGIDVHRSRVLRSADVTRLGLVPIATISRTLLEEAAHVSDPELEREVDNALISKRTTTDRLLRYLAAPELRSFEGIGRLRELVRDRELGVSANDFERALDSIYRDYALPPGLRNHPVRLPGRLAILDCAHVAERVGVEADGDGTHASRIDRKDDLERDHAATHKRWIILRFTYEHVTQEPAYVAWTIGRALGLRPTRWR